MTMDMVKHMPVDAALVALVDQAKVYGVASMSENTRRSYGAAWSDFAAWCEDRGCASMPADPSALCLYLVDRANTLSVTTLTHRLAAIRAAHLAAGHPAPAMTGNLKAVWTGIRRANGKPPVQKRAVRPEDLARMTTGDSLVATRDRALLLVGFAAALRRSELAALTLETGTVAARFVPEGLEIHLARSKADQEGHGAKVAIPYAADPALCPVRALKAWIAAAAIKPGEPVARPINKAGKIGAEALSGFSVACIVKAAAERIGLDPAAFGGHSLRAGLATAAAANEAPAHVLMRHMRHARFDTTQKYIREADMFKHNAATFALAGCM